MPDHNSDYNSEPDRFCPNCSAPLPENRPEGLCPACLLKMVGEPTHEPDEGVTAEKPSPAEWLSIELVRQAFPHLEVLELLGVGGMGMVFKARQPNLDRIVALKILTGELAEKPTFAERFAREGKLLAKLSHPNIVTVYDFGQTEFTETDDVDKAAGKTLTFFYLVMEYVDGVNMRQAMRNEKFTPRQALAIVPKICEALQYAHDEGVIHRDIKPENILLDTRGRIKIADFGIASVAHWIADDVPLPTPASDEDRLNSSERLTETGQILGTPNYMAPEQLEAPEQVDHRADIYSLGVVFYELLTGELPKGAYPLPSLKTEVTDGVDEIVIKALQRERSRRYQSATEMKTEIETEVLQAKQKTGTGSSESGINAEPENAPEGKKFSIGKTWNRMKTEIKTWPVWATILVGLAFVFWGIPLLLKLLLILIVAPFALIGFAPIEVFVVVFTIVCTVYLVRVVFYLRKNHRTRKAKAHDAAEESKPEQEKKESPIPSQPVKRVRPFWAYLAFVILCVSIYAAIQVPAKWYQNPTLARWVEQQVEYQVSQNRIAYWLEQSNKTRADFRPDRLAGTPQAFLDEYQKLYQEHLQFVLDKYDTAQENDKLILRNTIRSVYQEEIFSMIPVLSMRLVLAGFLVSGLISMIYLFRMRKIDQKQGVVLAGITAFTSAILLAMVSWIYPWLIEYNTYQMAFLRPWMKEYWFLFTIAGVVFYFVTIFLAFFASSGKMVDGCRSIVPQRGILAFLLIVLPVPLILIGNQTLKVVPNIYQACSFYGKELLSEEYSELKQADQFFYDKYCRLLEEHGFPTSAKPAIEYGVNEPPPTETILTSYIYRSHSTIPSIKFHLPSFMLISHQMVIVYYIFVVIVFLTVPALVYAAIDIVLARKAVERRGVGWSVIAIDFWPGVFIILAFVFVVLMPHPLGTYDRKVTVVLLPIVLSVIAIMGLGFWLWLRRPKEKK